MGNKRDLNLNGTSYRLLEYIFVNGSVTTKQAMLAEPYTGRSTIGTALRELRSRGYIEPLLPYGRKDTDGSAGCNIGNGRKTYYVITEDGIRHFGKKSPQARKITDLARVETSLARAKKEEARNDIEAMIHGAGIYTYRFHKPSFENFVWLINDELDEPEEYPAEYPLTDGDELPELLEKGLYYTNVEIRKGAEKVGFEIDTWFSTRIIGAVFTSADIYLIYRFDDRGYMTMIREIEQELIRSLKTLLPVYARTPVCVMMSKSYKAAAAICLGQKNGRDRSEEKHQAYINNELKTMTEENKPEFLSREEKRRKKKKYYTIKRREETSNTLTGDTSLFRELYVLPVTIPSVPAAIFIFNHNSRSISSDGKAWFQSHAGFGLSLTSENLFLTGRCVLTEPFTDAVYVPVIDCKMLTELRNHQSRNRLTIVTNPELADVISHILGPAVYRFYNMEGQELTGIARYKTTGFPVNEDRYAQIAQALKKRAQERTAAGCMRKTGLSLSVSPELKARISELSRKSGISCAALGAVILEYAMTYHNAELLEFIDSKAVKLLKNSLI